MNKLTRRSFLSKAAGAAAGAAVASAFPESVMAQVAKSSSKKPNVLFIMSDDMRVELGCYASMFNAKTPNLDKLAQTGVRFDRNYCQFPICNPSRTSLLTGRRATVTGVLGNTTAFRDVHPNWVTLPQLFKENGYTSLRTGKIYHGGMDDPKAWNIGYGVAEGFVGAGVPRATEISRRAGQIIPPGGMDFTKAGNSDRLITLSGNGEGNGDYTVADTCIKYLNEYKDKPFFIGCGFSKPHSPPAAPQWCYDLYKLDDIELTPDFADRPTVPPGFPKAAIRPRNADLFIGRNASRDEAKEVIQAYLASISWVDWNLGRVLAELDKLGLRENTIITFVADHGYQLGEKGKWSKAGSLFEMGTRVPMMICAPGMKGNGTPCTNMVQSLDMYPTIVELCGLPTQKENEGKSLVPLLNDPHGTWTDPAYSIWSEDGKTIHGTMIRTPDWRYVEYGKDAINGTLLFDVHKDPLEMTNLADDAKYADVKAKLSPLVREYAAALNIAAGA